MTKKPVLFFLVFLALLFLIFRNLILNLSTNLPDWLDYALMVWIVFQNTSKIISLNFSNFFDTNAFYPHQNTLFFSDTLIPQSLIFLPFQLLTGNLILSFNIVFLLTFVLNYISAFLLWKQIFKDNLTAFIGSLLIVFSPFFHLEFAHFQSLSFWPFLFGLYFIFKNEQTKNISNLLFAGFFLAIQFLAGAYLAVFFASTIIIFYLIKFLTGEKLIPLLKNGVIIFGVFAILDGIFIKGYLDTQKAYQIKRDIREYITYSAHLSDYVFTTRINSSLHQLPIIEKWNQFDKNHLDGKAAFPGFLLTSAALAGLLTLAKRKGKILLALTLDKQKAFFISLVIIGFLFSLGPRLNFNGNYAHIPLPYNLVLKTTPFIEAVRVPSRWSFLFYFALVYFGLTYLKKLNLSQPKPILLGVISILLLLEYVPPNLSTHYEQYINEKYTILKNICGVKKQALLEIPVTHLDVVQGIGEGVNYISKVQLSSTYHGCNLINGYSGYDLPAIFDLRDGLYKAIENYDTETFIAQLKKNQVDILKINQEFLIKEIQKPSTKFLENLKKSKEIETLNYNFFKIK